MVRRQVSLDLPALYLFLSGLSRMVGDISHSRFKILDWVIENNTFMFLQNNI